MSNVQLSPLHNVWISFMQPAVFKGHKCKKVVVELYCDFESGVPEKFLPVLSKSERSWVLASSRGFAVVIDPDNAYERAALSLSVNLTEKFGPGHEEAVLNRDWEELFKLKPFRLTEQQMEKPKVTKRTYRKNTRKVKEEDDDQ